MPSQRTWPQRSLCAPLSIRLGNARERTEVMLVHVPWIRSHAGIQLMRVIPHQNSPLFVLDAPQNNLGCLICAGWRLVAKLQALLMNHFAQLVITQVHEVSRVVPLLMHQPFPKVFYFLLGHIEGIGMTQHLSGINRYRRADMAGHDDRYIDMGALIRRSVMSASLKPFTANFAAA